MATVSGERLGLLCLTNFFRQHLREITNDVPHVMQLTLPCDVARNSAGVLNVLMTVENLPDSPRCITHWVPKMNRKDQRIPAWIVVEDHFGWRVRKDAAVPIELAVDTHRRKGRRQRA